MKPLINFDGIRRWLPGLVLAVSGLSIGALLMDFRLDDAFITYRYAHNLAAGTGFVYNPGQPILSITNPLYGLILSLAAFAAPLPAVGSVMGTLAVTGSAYLIFALVNHGIGGEELPAWGAGLFMLGFPLLWLTLGLETPLHILTGLLAIWLYVRGHTLWSAAALGVGTLLRPDMPILAVLIAVHSVWARRALPWRQVAIFALTLLPWAIYSTLIYGSPLPATLGAKSAQAALGITGFAPSVTYFSALGLLARALFEQSTAWVIVGMAALAGLWALRDRSRAWAWLITGWGAAHAAAYIVMGVAPYRWYYAPLVPGLAVLFGLGVWQISLIASKAIKAWAAAACLIALMIAAAQSLYLLRVTQTQPVAFLQGQGIEMLPTVDWDIYHQTGDWLHANTPPDATIGVAEVGQIGFYAQRTMIDYLGLLQPEIAASLERGDIYWWLPHYTPDYLVLSEAEGFPALYGYSLAGDPWFAQMYAEVARFEDGRYTRSPMVIYERVQAGGPWYQISEAEVMLAEGATLTWIRADFDPQFIRPGMPVRVETGWIIDGQWLNRQQTAIRLLSLEGDLAAQADRQFDFSTWPQTEASLFHTMVTADELKPGAYEIQVGLGPDPDQMNWHSAGLARVPQQIQPAVADYEALNQQLGSITLEGYRIQSGGQLMQLDVLWRAEGRIEGRYKVFVHILDEQGQIIAQHDGEPRNGTYPTSIWQAERIADTYSISLPGRLPPNYRLIIGLYDFEGCRLLTPQGEDHIEIPQADLP